MTNQRQPRGSIFRPFAIAAAISLCSFAGCPNASPPDDSALDQSQSNGNTNSNETTDDAGTGIYEVTLAPDARLLPAPTVQQSLIEVSTDRSRFRFSDSDTEVKTLQVGQVVVVAGQAVRRISAINRSPGEIVLDTGPASLNEAIRDGRIGWQRPVNFASMPDLVLDDDADPSFTIQTVSGSSKLAGQSQSNTKKFKVAGNLQGWDISAEFEPTAERLNVDLRGTYAMGGVRVASVHGKGWVSNFAQQADIGFAGGQTTHAVFENLGLKGEMNIEWHAFKPEGNVFTDVFKLRIPVAIPIPVSAGPIPFVIKLKAAMRIVPELRFDLASSGGSLKVTFDSDAGISLSEEKAQVLGQLIGHDVQITGETVSAALSLTTGMGCGIEFPSIEIGLPGELATANITVDSYAYSLYRAGLLSGETSCQCAGLNLKATTGYELSLLGLLSYSDSTEIWRTEFVNCLNDVSCD